MYSDGHLYLKETMTTRKKEKGEQVSHKVIEKRRRDRINNCLAELSQTIPAAFAKQTSGKLEKAEILEMTVEYLRAINAVGQKFDTGDIFSPLLYSEFQRHYSAGYSECVHEVLRYITEVEGFQIGDTRCTRMLSYLQSKCASLVDSVGMSKKVASSPASTNTSSTLLSENATASKSGHYVDSPTITVSNNETVTGSNYFPYSATDCASLACPSIHHVPNHCFGCDPFIPGGGSRIATADSLNLHLVNKVSSSRPPLCSTFKPTYASPDLFPYSNLYAKHSLGITVPTSILTYSFPINPKDMPF